MHLPTLAIYGLVAQHGERWIGRFGGALWLAERFVTASAWVTLPEGEEL